ncbi:MAG: site-2 protease family protein [Treponema sp.]|nr:site-2 protease family protein [Candidatus Treponema equifaecale]
MTVVLGIILLGFLVFIHEAGHFVAARISGVTVESFSIGMGPVLCHKQIKGTDWRISLLPFGGYCGMKGEKDAELLAENPEAYVEKDSFYGVGGFQRAFIGFAGPFFNVFFAFLAYSVVAMVGYSYYSAGNRIKLVTDAYPEMHSAAADCGILSWDKIVQINSKEMNDFSEIYAEIATHPDEDITILVERNGELLNFTAHTDMNKNSGEGKLGVMSDPASVEKREAKRYGFFSAFAQGGKEVFSTIGLTFKGIGTLFKGVKITESVSGPARITTMLGDTAKSGFSAGFRTGLSSLLQFMAMISISLFIMNLLPIPVLDGFLVLTSLIEAIFGLRVSPKVRNIVQYIGIAIIAFLFVVALTGDFHYFAGLFNAKK